MYISFHWCLLLDWFHIQFLLKISKAFCQVFPNAATCSWSWGRMKISVLKPRVMFTVCLSAQDFYYSVKHPLNPPTRCILLFRDLFITACEKRNFLSPLHQNIHLRVLNLWTVARTAATLSSVTSETLFGRASQNSAVLLLTFPLLRGGLIIFNCITLWITSGSTSAFLLSHICSDLLAWFCFSFPPWLLILAFFPHLLLLHLPRFPVLSVNSSNLDPFLVLIRYFRVWEHPTAISFYVCYLQLSQITVFSLKN